MIFKEFSAVDERVVTNTRKNLGSRDDLQFEILRNILNISAREYSSFEDGFFGFSFTQKIHSTQYYNLGRRIRNSYEEQTARTTAIKI